jgi:hypothetical protein
MSERGDTAQNGGPPDRRKKVARKSRRANGTKKSGARGAAKTIEEGRRNEQIFMERLAGRSARALATQFGLSTRQIHDIVKACREAGIAELELGEPWRSQRFAEEYLLEIEEATNSLRELELSAREQNNISSELGGLKQRIQLARDRMRFLQDARLMSGPRHLKFDAEVSQFWSAVNKAFDEHDVPDAVRAAIDAKLASTPEAEPGLAPAHWLWSTPELEAALQRERDAVERERAQAELLRQGAERKDVERKQKRLKWHEEAEQRVYEEKRKSAGQFEEIQRNNAVAGARWADAEKIAGERGLDLQSMSPEDLRRFLGSEAPLENYET